MKIPNDIRKKYLLKPDPEAEFFLDFFDEDPRALSNTTRQSLVLEVGANDNNLGIMLGEAGFDVLGLDLMPHADGKNYRHIVADFCDRALNMLMSGWQHDIIYSVSAIEHFGLRAYGESSYQPYYDVVAMRYIYDLLKTGGVAYIAVPFGGRQAEVNPHWRVYDDAGLKGRIIQNFEVEKQEFRVVELNGFKYPEPLQFQTYEDFVANRPIRPAQTTHVPCGTIPTQAMIQSLMNGEPYISCLLKLRKK